MRYEKRNILEQTNRFGEISHDVLESQPRLFEESISAKLSGLPELQRARRDEIAEVVSLLNRAYRKSNDNMGWTTEVGLIDGDRDSEPLLRRELDEKLNASLMVWKPDGRVRGCVCIESGDNRQWHLGSFAVEPNLQNNQIGRRILNESESIIRNQGGHAIRITVVDSRDTLVAWYERRGYRRTGETVPFPYSEARFGVPTRKGIRLAILVKLLN